MVAVVAVVLVVLVVSLGVPSAGRFLSCSKIVQAYADMSVLLRVCVCAFMLYALNFDNMYL